MNKKGFTIMKSTGIVRRIDDLGRIAIPKEVRRAMHIKAGDPLEVYTDKDGSIIFRKYIDDQFAQWAQYLHRYFGDALIIYNIDGVKMCGTTEDDWRDPDDLKQDPAVLKVNRDIGETIVYCDTKNLRGVEASLLHTLVDFIESQLEADID
jgi:AbrB family looped-hinge helix DNA binding protein